jgi:uncharacterized RDD family membrane protein YckC
VEIDDRFVAATPEGVSLEFVLAGLGSRFLAILLDLILQAAVIAIVVLALTKLIGFSTPTRQYVTTGAISLVGVLLILGYFVLFESLNAGRTPGKAMTGLRVVRVTGGPVGLRASLLRNVVRLVDWLPSLYAVGAVLILATRNHQRLGDMLAGTLVVRERTAVSRLATGTAWNHQSQWGAPAWSNGPPPGTPPAGAATWPGAAGPGWASQRWLPPELSHWDVTNVSAPELDLVNRFLAGRGGYTAEARSRLASDLASRLWPRVAGPTGPMDPEAFLEAVVLVKSVRG